MTLNTADTAFLSIVNEAFVWATFEMGKFLAGDESAVTGDLGAAVYLFEKYGLTYPKVGLTTDVYESMKNIATLNSRTGRGNRKATVEPRDIDVVVDWFHNAFDSDITENYNAPDEIFNGAVDVLGAYIAQTAVDGRPPVDASFVRDFTGADVPGDDPNYYGWDEPPKDPNYMDIIEVQEAEIENLNPEPPIEDG